jgi:hypothetical protein
MDTLKKVTSRQFSISLHLLSVSLVSSVFFWWYWFPAVVAYPNRAVIRAVPVFSAMLAGAFLHSYLPII